MNSLLKKLTAFFADQAHQKIALLAGCTALAVAGGLGAAFAFHDGQQELPVSATVNTAVSVSVMNSSESKSQMTSSEEDTTSSASVDSSSDSVEEEKDPIEVKLQATSATQDLNVNIVDMAGAVVRDVPFMLRVTGQDDHNNDYDYMFEVDKRYGSLYVTWIPDGKYLLTLQEIEGYIVPEPQEITVKKYVVKYEEIKDIEEEVVKDTEIDASKDDNAFGGGGGGGDAGAETETPPPTVTDTVTFVESSKKEGTEPIKDDKGNYLYTYTYEVGPNGNLLLAANGSESDVAPVANADNVLLHGLRWIGTTADIAVIAEGSETVSSTQQARALYAMLTVPEYLAANAPFRWDETTPTEQPTTSDTGSSADTDSSVSDSSSAADSSSAESSSAVVSSSDSTSSSSSSESSTTDSSSSESSPASSDSSSSESSSASSESSSTDSSSSSSSSSESSSSGSGSTESSSSDTGSTDSGSGSDSSAQKYTITFLDLDGKTISQVAVTPGGTATVPQVADVTRGNRVYRFKNWATEAYKQVKADASVQAIYDVYEVVKLFNADNTPDSTYKITATKQTKKVWLYTGWQTIDGKTYYYTAENKKVTGWQVIQGISYFFNTDGVRSDCMGIDVSRWNGTIDWKKVKAAGIDFAIIRVGYRGYGTGKLVEDTTARTNLAGATAAGIKVGVYVFSQAINQQEAVEEASLALSIVKGYKLDYPIFIDSEYSTSAKDGRADALAAPLRTAICEAFCKTVANSGYRTGVYASKSWFQYQLNVAALENYHIWLAHYTTATDYARRYDMWQYTSTATVPGISGGVDMNFSYLNY